MNAQARSRARSSDTLGPDARAQCGVGLDMRAKLIDRVTAEARQERARDLERDDILHHHARGGHGADIAALVRTRLRLATAQIDARHALAQGRNRFHRAGDDHRHAVGHAAFESAGVVARPHEAAVRLIDARGIERNRVVHIAAKPRCDRAAEPDLDALERLDAHDGGGDPRIEPLEPLRAAAETGGRAEDMHFAPASDCVFRRLRAVNALDERGARLRVRHIDFARVALRSQVAPVRVGDFDARDDIEPAAHETEGLDAEFAQQHARERPRCHARRRLARTRAFEHIAAVIRVELSRASQVRMSRSRSMHRRRALQIIEATVAILDLHEDRRADRATKANTRKESHAIVLDALSTAAPVAALPALQLRVDELRVDRKSGGHALDERADGRTVRFTRRAIGERHASMLTLRSNSDGPPRRARSARAQPLRLIALRRLAARMLRVHELRKSFGPICAVDGLSLEVRRGEVFGLLGPNGAGKSTTISMCIGLIEPDSGTVELEGVGSPREAHARQRLGLAPQTLALYEDLTAEENLIFFGRLYGVAAPRARAAELLELIGLSARGRDRVKGFSGGMKRRLNLAVALVQHPEIVLLDEPTAGVDPQSRASILELVRSLAAKGVTVVYTTHYMDEAQRVCDRVAIIDHGRVLALGTVEELMRKYGGEVTVVVERGDTSERHPTSEPLVVIAAVLERGDATGVRVERPDLESVFLTLTGRSLRD